MDEFFKFYLTSSLKSNGFVTYDVELIDFCFVPNP